VRGRPCAYTNPCAATFALGFPHPLLTVLSPPLWWHAGRREPRPVRGALCMRKGAVHLLAAPPYCVRLGVRPQTIRGASGGTGEDLRSCIVTHNDV